MLKIKQEIDLNLLKKFGFEENGFYESYIFETRSKKGNHIFIIINKNTRIIEDVVHFGVSDETFLQEKFVEFHCSSIFQAGFVEEVN